MVVNTVPTPLPNGAIAQPRIASTKWKSVTPESDALRSHLHALRAVVDKPFPVKLLHTVHGIGYQIRVPDAS